MKTLDLTQTPQMLQELLRRMQTDGEEIAIRDGGQMIARIIPARTGGRSPGSARGQVHLRDDFDDPLEDFEGHR